MGPETIDIDISSVKYKKWKFSNRPNTYKGDSLQVDPPEITAAGDWLEANHHGEAPGTFEIVKAYLQDVKKLKSACSLRVVTQLTAVLEYVSSLIANFLVITVRDLMQSRLLLP